MFQLHVSDSDVFFPYFIGWKFKLNLHLNFLLNVKPILAFSQFF